MPYLKRIWRTAAPPIDVKSSLQSDDTTRISLKSAGNSAFLVNIEVGSGRRPFNVVLDTGSVSFWLPGVGCSCAGPHRRYSPSSSTSSMDVRQGFSASYGSGSVNGRVVRDDVWLGGLHLRLDMGVISNACELQGFDEAPYDGVLGLGLLGTIEKHHPNRYGADKAGHRGAALEALRRLSISYFELSLGNPEGSELVLAGGGRAAPPANLHKGFSFLQVDGD